MRFLAAFIFLAITGCMPVTRKYYLPIDPSQSYESVYCGSVPWGYAKIVDTPQFNFSFNASPEENSIRFGIQINLLKGQSIRFISPELIFIDANNNNRQSVQLEKFRIGIYGRNGQPGYLEYVLIDMPLEGKGRNAELETPNTPYLKYDQFGTGSKVNMPPPENLFVILPPLEVNGEITPSQTLKLRLVTKSGLETCLQ